MRSSRKRLLLIGMILGWAALASAQGLYEQPYYGKNKVQYGRFAWKSYSTEHFQIYFYNEDLDLLKSVAELAESAYQKISRFLKHEMSVPVPILYYTTYTDFEQTNLFPVSEGILGVSEPALYRIGIYGDMPLDELQALVEHELAHVFEFDILWGKPGAGLYAVSQPPAWVFEGFSEFATETWSPWSSLIVRDAVLTDRIPEISEGGELVSPAFLPRDPAYDFGHAIYEFINHKYGETATREFWQSLQNSPLIGKRDPLQRAFAIKVRDFNFEFKKYLREKNKEFLLRDSPEDYSNPLGPSFPANPYYFDLSHAVSPSGDLLAGLSYNLKDQEVDVILIATDDGRVLKNITRGFTRRWEYIKYEVDASRGRNIDWSPDGDRLAFFGRDGDKYSLYVVRPLSGALIQKRRIPLDQPHAPCFLPGGGALLFTAFRNGLHDIYRLDLASGAVDNLTRDALYEKAPAVSPDGKTLAYTIHLRGFDKIFVSPLDNLKKKTQLTFGEGNTISPCFSADGQTLFFSGDLRGAFNIYSLDLGTGQIKRYGDVRTGNYFPTPLPGRPGEIVFSSFHKGAFQIFKDRPEGTPEGTSTFAELPEDAAPKAFEPLVTLEIKKDKIAPYRGIGKLFLANRPPLDTFLATDGSFYGGSALLFSDLLANHSLYVEASQVRGFRSYAAAYLNQGRRLQFMASAFKYTRYYYPPYAYFNPTLYSTMTYADALATRTITGATAAAFYPFNKYYRAEANIGFFRYAEEFLDPSVAPAGSYQYFWNGNVLSAGFSLTGETTRFRYPYGPAAGSTFHVSISQSIPVARNFFRNTNLEVDLRRYLYVGMDSLFALRFRGFASRGRDPYIFYFGGNNQVRSVDYMNIVASEGWYANAEFRMPLITAAATVLGTIGPVRGMVFFDFSRAKLSGYPAKFFVYNNPLGIPSAAYDAVGSYGYGLEVFFLGLPLHFDWVKRLYLPTVGRPFDIKSQGGFLLRFWIGYDF
jgi:WD40 repeat protein